MSYGTAKKTSMPAPAPAHPARRHSSGSGSGSGSDIGPASRSPNPNPNPNPEAVNHDGRSANDSTTERQDASSSDDTSFRGRVSRIYRDNIGLFFVAIAQIFASIMAMTTRLLETGFDTKFHALQIIFIRLAVTAVISSLYMWYKSVPGFPLGPPRLRGLLILRGLAGSFGLFCLYYSLSYLDISDSTVITFLVPTFTSFVCWLILREPFTIVEALAGILALIGVLFIARPRFIFSHFSGLHSLDGIFKPVPATPAQRSLAVLLAVLGSLSAATAYATIRVIGTRVHSLVSVNYFALLGALISCLVLLLHPHLGFQIPQSMSQWLLLLSIGLSGFLLQLLLTEGLQRERGGRAANMIYTQLVSALIIERIVWGTTPPLESFIGSALIIGAAIWVGLQKKDAAVAGKPSPVADEETSLLNPPQASTQASTTN